MGKEPEDGVPTSPWDSIGDGGAAMVWAAKREVRLRMKRIPGQRVQQLLWSQPETRLARNRVQSLQLRKLQPLRR